MCEHVEGESDVDDRLGRVRGRIVDLCVQAIARDHIEMIARGEQVKDLRSESQPLLFSGRIQFHTDEMAVAQTRVNHAAHRGDRQHGIAQVLLRANKRRGRIADVDDDQSGRKHATD